MIDVSLNRSTDEDTFKITLQPDENVCFFPNNIILRCPKQLPFHKSFVVSSLWLESENQLRTISASYGADSKLIDVHHQYLSR